MGLLDQENNIYASFKRFMATLDSEQISRSSIEQLIKCPLLVNDSVYPLCWVIFLSAVMEGEHEILELCLVQGIGPWWHVEELTADVGQNLGMNMYPHHRTHSYPVWAMSLCIMRSNLGPGVHCKYYNSNNKFHCHSGASLQITTALYCLSPFAYSHLPTDDSA